LGGRLKCWCRVIRVIRVHVEVGRGDAGLKGGRVEVELVV
jgi:hypothetical protein